MADHDTAATPPPVPTSALLRDGRRVPLRPIAGDDGARLLRFHHSLSAETQYLRFFGAHPSLSEEEVDWFTHVDHRDREALVAVDGDDLLGVGRLDRLACGTDAEVAFVVADHVQGQGLGRQLLDALAARARVLGVERLVADTLPHNRKMLAVFRRSGLALTRRFEDGVVRVVLDLGPAASEPAPAARSLAKPVG